MSSPTRLLGTWLLIECSCRPRALTRGYDVVENIRLGCQQTTGCVVIEGAGASAYANIVVSNRLNVDPSPPRGPKTRRRCPLALDHMSVTNFLLGILRISGMTFDVQDL